MTVPEELRYTKTHEWIREDGTEATMGITHFAQEELTDIVFVELPALNQDVTRGKLAAVVESVKAASDIFAPLSGTVVAVNEDLREHPELINQDPYGQGWIFQIRMRETHEVEWLLTAGGYRELIGDEEE